MLDKIKEKYHKEFYKEEFKVLNRVHNKFEVNWMSGVQVLLTLNKHLSGDIQTSETTGRKIKNLFLKYYG